MKSTNYYETFIAVAPDSDAVRGTVPKETENPSVAFRTFKRIHEHPYRYTSDDVVFAVYAERKGIPEAKPPEARNEFFSKPQQCLRASDLGKQYGWGIHFDSQARIALYAVESNDYSEFITGKRNGSSGKPITIKRALRSRR